MKPFFQRLIASLAPLLAMVIFVIIFILGIFVFSYLLIFVAIIGLALFIVSFIRSKLTRQKKSPHPKHSQGRLIEHHEIQENDEKK